MFVCFQTGGPAHVGVENLAVGTVQILCIPNECNMKYCVMFWFGFKMGRDARICVL